MLVELAKSAALLLALGYLQGFVSRLWPNDEYIGRVFSGLLFGGICVIGMLSPIEFSKGVIFDGRFVILSTASFFLGPIVGFITAAIAGLFRIWIGGAGAFLSLGAVFTSVIIGLVYRHGLAKGWFSSGLFQYLIFGIVVHVTVLLWMLLLPPEIAMKAVQSVGPPMVLVFGPATAIFGLLLQDIKTRVSIEKNLSSAREQFNDAIENISEGFVLFDADGRLVVCNSQYKNFYGYSDEDSKPGRHTRDLGLLDLERQTVIHSGEPESYVERREAPHHLREKLIIHLKDGRILEVRDRRTDSGGVVSIQEDVTAREQARQALQQANDELEHRVEERTLALSQEVVERKQAEEKAAVASRAKSDLMANMSHELRTPLNAIIGFSATMLSETFGPHGNEKYKEYLNDIHQSGQHLLELINDILDVSAIEENALDLHEGHLVIGDIFDASLHLVGPQAAKGKIRLTSSVEPDIPLIYVDGRRVKQVLLNLLSNAIKFTPEGGDVTLTAKREADGSIVLRVVDTGIGMNKDEVEMALSKFGQIESGLNRRHEGTGLGLPLSKGLMELHGGSLEITSEKGVGTTVIIKIPKERVDSNIELGVSRK